MAYADFADVQARAGRFAPIFEVTGKRPDESDVSHLLADCASEIDAAISSAGFSPSSLSAEVKGALRDLNAYGALARALVAADPGPEADDLIERARKVWGHAMGDPTSNTVFGQRGSIVEGTFPGLAALKATGGPSAGSFWDSVEVEDADLAPRFARSQTL